MDLFNEENIITGEDVDNLFEPVSTVEDKVSTEEPVNDSENTEEQKSKETVTEVNPDELFGEPESVGNEESHQEQGNATSKRSGSSPNIYSSIAKALQEEGIFPDLEDDDVKNIGKPEDFVSAIEKQINARLDERQKRIDKALGNGVETTVIKQYENTLSYLNNITEESIEKEGEEGDGIRKQLIYQDYINRGFTKERAQRELNKSLDNGTDIEDAKEALESNKEYFNTQYQTILNDAETKKKNQESELKKRAEELRKSILEDRDFFGDNLTRESRQKIHDNIVKPIYKDPKTGEYLTALQKYESENKEDFLKYIGYFFTQTNGFKDFSKLVSAKVNKEVKRGLKGLEATLNNTQRDFSGNLNFMSGVNSDSESFFRKGFDLDV